MVQRAHLASLSMNISNCVGGRHLWVSSLSCFLAGSSSDEERLRGFWRYHWLLEKCYATTRSLVCYGTV